jgi:ribonucleoside-diphosphate reductase alpha chain
LPQPKSIILIVVSFGRVPSFILSTILLPIVPPKKEEVETVYESYAPRRAKIIECDILRFQNNKEKWIGFVGTIEGRPYELFTGKHESFFLPPYVEKGRIVKRKTDKGSIYDFVYLDKDGIEIVMKKLSRSFNKEYWNYAKLISGILRQRMPMQYVVALVESLDLDDGSLTTWKKGVIRVFKKFIKDGTKTKGECPNCGADLVLIEGCEKCIACGKYSRCG